MEEMSVPVMRPLVGYSVATTLNVITWLNLHFLCNSKEKEATNLRSFRGHRRGLREEKKERN